MKEISSSLDHLAVNTIRFLSIDQVEAAGSGHPGLPMGCADIAHVLYTRHLRYNPDDPEWHGRDRFVLSAGHGSALLYSMLHIAGYELPMEELENFRQWGSMTPGHPEYGHTPGVETTTGPLGQGFANGIGMAVAAKALSARFATDEFDPFDYTVYALVSDGDLMEGISSEAGSLAGHLELDNLVYIYDSNDISIEGSTGLAFTEDRAKRFEALGWAVKEIDGHDHKQIDEAICWAKEQNAPALIVANTRIGFGSPSYEGDAECHGKALGADERAATANNLKWVHEPFHVPDQVRDLY